MILMARRFAPETAGHSGFHVWFDKALERRGLSLAELARRVESDYTHLWKIMRGDPTKYPTSSRPGYELTVAIGRELGDEEGALIAAGYKEKHKGRGGSDTPEIERVASDTTRQELDIFYEGLSRMGKKRAVESLRLLYDTERQASIGGTRADQDDNPTEVNEDEAGGEG